MLCFYCKNNQHFSQNCNSYVTDEARKEILVENLCCSECTGLPSNGYDNEWCPYCYYHRKCYCCFSKAHHTEDCPERFKELSIFVPNIDRDLLPRFMYCLSTEERYSFFYFCPVIFLRIKYEKEIQLSSKEITSKLKLDILVADKVHVARYHKGQTLGLSKFKSTIFRFELLEIDLSTLSSEEFLRLLSTKTKILKCRKSIQLNPTLKFREILEKAPNLEEIDIQHSNIETGNTWPRDLLKCAENIKKIYLSISSCNMKNVKVLANLIKTKNVKCNIYITAAPNAQIDKREVFNTVKNKLLKHFVLALPENQQQVLTVSFKCNCSSDSAKFVLKNF